MDCGFSYKNIGEKSDVVGYCLWCDRDKLQKAMETHHGRAAIPKKKEFSFFMVMTTIYYVWRLLD